MEAIGEVDVAEQESLLSQTIGMALRYGSGNGRKGEVASMYKQKFVSANVSLILEQARRRNVKVNGKETTIFTILEESHQRRGSGPTLYWKEPEAIVTFVTRVMSDILASKPLSPVVGKVPQGASPANDSQSQEVA